MKRINVEYDAGMRLMTEGNKYTFMILKYILNKCMEQKTRIVVIPYAELKEALDISDNTVCRNLRLLKQCGIVKRGLNTSELCLEDTLAVLDYEQLL